LQAAQQIINVGKAGRDTGDAAAALLRRFRRFHRPAQCLVEFQRPFAIFAGFADGIERFFGFLYLGLGAFVGWRLISGIDDILANADQAAAHRQIMQDAGIIAHIGHGRRRRHQAGEIGDTAQFDQTGIGLHRGMQSERRQDKRAALKRLRHGFEDAGMQRIVKMIRLDQRADPLQRLVVHQQRAQQRLLDLDVIGDVAIGVLFHCCSQTALSRPPCRGLAIKRLSKGATSANPDRPQASRAVSRREI